MKAQVNQVVYNKRYNTIGIILDVFTNGDIRTDADGVVYASDLKILKTFAEMESFKRIINAHVAPSTLSLINDNSLLK